MLEKTKKLSPLLKYPGGKEKELSFILPNIPKEAKRYFEPFVGGGAVFFALDAEEYFINDKSSELISLYKLIKNQDGNFIDKIQQIDHNWNILSNVISNHLEKIISIYQDYKALSITKAKLQDLISEFVFKNTNEFNGVITSDFNIGIDNFINELIKSFKNKIIRLREIDVNNSIPLSKEQVILNIECAFKTAFYMHFRYLHNSIDKYEIDKSFETAIYFFIREYCYSSMFRYNSFGKFNVPYGGISYNKKSLEKKINYFLSQDLYNHFAKTTIEELDFYDFVQKYIPRENDFIFLDPPYDTDFSTYAKNTFEKADQIRLADYLKNECDGYFMLVIKDTPFIKLLYTEKETVKNGRELNIRRFDKKYFVSFQNRNKKEAEHLIITNY